MATKKTTSKKPKKPAAKKSPSRRASLSARKKTAAPKRPKTTKQKALHPEKPKAGPPENPQAKALAHRMAQLVLDRKALDVVVLDVRGMTSYADYFVVASGESDRQVTAMAEHVQEQLKHVDGLRPVGFEGTETGQWVLLDYGEVVAHLFFTEARSHYDLEGLWADAPRERFS